MTVEELEGRRRRDIEEQLIKRDLKRQKLHEAHNTPDAVAQAAEMNDPVMVRRRGRMMLPAPQVSETELEQIARMSTEALLDEEMMDGAGGDTTRGLLGQYGPTPARLASALPTPARTAPSGDRILMEAQNQARLQSMATPLVGGENPELNPSDFSGITPRPSVLATPNPLSGALTPGAGAGAAGMSVRRSGMGTAIAGVPSTPSVAGTPLRGAGRVGGGAPGATPMRTPIRDELGLNDADSLAMYGVPADTKRAEQARLAALRSEVRAGLSSLPAPQNEYQLVAPEMPEDAMDTDQLLEEDAADAKARKLREEAALAAEEEKKKSKVGGMMRNCSKHSAAVAVLGHCVCVLWCTPCVCCCQCWLCWRPPAVWPVAMSRPQHIVSPLVPWHKHPAHLPSLISTHLTNPKQTNKHTARTHTHAHTYAWPPQALQRGLPRPKHADLLPAPRPATEWGKLSLRERAEDLVVREVRTLLDHDAAKYPVIPVGKEAKKVG